MTIESNTMTAVSLYENEDGEAVIGDVPIAPALTNDVEIKNTNTSDEEIDSLLKDLHNDLNPSVTTNNSNQEALDNLRRSTTSFTSTIGAVTKNIDSKFHVSTNAQQIDNKLGVSSTVSRTSETVAGLWDKVRSSTATKIIQKSVGDTVHKGKRVVGETVDRTGLKESMRGLDEKHGITQGTLGALAGGMDLLNKTLVSVSKVNSQDGQDYDGLVSSPVDNESDLKIGDDQVKGDRQTQ